MPTDQASASGTRLVRLALVLASSLLSLALCEAWATAHLGDRFVRGAELGNGWRIAGRPDPELGWSGRPGAHGRIVSGQLDYTVRLNSAGHRDPERAPHPAPGVRRVVALGDSVTWGWGVQAGERFTDLLDARLGDEIEVLNLACPGYGTDQHLWSLLDRGLGYEPDAVLLCVILNDVIEAASAEVYDMPKPRFVRAEDGTWSVEGRPVPVDPDASAGPGVWTRCVRASALLTWVSHQPLPVPAAQEEPTAYRPPTEDVLRLVTDTAAQLEDPTTPARHALELLKATCAERGLPLVVTTVAHKHDQYLYEPHFPEPATAPVEGDRATALTRSLRAACRDLALPLVETDRAFWDACRSGTRLHAGDGHPNAAGHRLLADLLEPRLRAALAR